MYPKVKVLASLHYCAGSSSILVCGINNTISHTDFLLPSLINVKIVGILTFISMINTTSERLKAKNFFICRYFSFYERLKSRAQLS